MNEEKKKRGGHRPGAGRPKGVRNKAVTFKLSDRAMEKLEKVKNKSQYIDNLIIDDERYD